MFLPGRRPPAMIIALVTVLLLTAAPAGADAGGQRDDSTPIPPEQAPCATATLSQIVWDGPGGYEGFVVIGAATQCAPTVTAGYVTIATYRRGAEYGIVTGHRTFPSAEPGAVRRFGVKAREGGICVTVAGNRRVACALITVPPDKPRGNVVTLTPLSTDDPLVTKNLVPVDPRENPDFCGACF